MTFAALTAAQRPYSVGPQLTAAMNYLAGCHGLRKRAVEETVETFFEVPIALGTVANLEQEMSAALAQPHEQARQAVAKAPRQRLARFEQEEMAPDRCLGRGLQVNLPAHPLLAMKCGESWSGIRSPSARLDAAAVNSG